jgi:transcriptional regulator with XRE-family HTH domain
VAEVAEMTTRERIKKRREELGISADILAEKIGVSRSTMFRYESGSIEKVDINKLALIAIALSTTVHYLMGWDDDKSSDEIKKLATESDDELDAELIRLLGKISQARKPEAIRYLQYLSSAEEQDMQ